MENPNGAFSPLEEESLVGDDDLESTRSSEVRGGLVVKVYGLRGLPEAAANKQVYCKVSINSVHKKTSLTKAETTAENQVICIIPNPEELRRWRIGSPHNLSFDDLLIIRVKYLGTMNWQHNLGSVSIAAREVSERGTADSKAWFPLSVYEDQKNVSGEICLGLYWDEVDELFENRSVQDDELGSPERRHSGGLGIPRTRLRSSIRTALGISIHKTQEMLIRDGASKVGLSINSTGVSLEGRWQSAPPAISSPRSAPPLRPIIHSITDLDGGELATEPFTANPNLNIAAPVLDSTKSEKTAQDGQVEIEEVDEEKPHPLLENHSRSVLLIEVIEARGLLAADSNGLSDPYCIIKLRNAKRKTKVHYKTLTPLWNEHFIFGGDKNKKELVSLDDTVTIIVKDRDTIGFDDDLGMIELPLWAIKNHRSSPTNPATEEGVGSASSPHQRSSSAPPTLLVRKKSVDTTIINSSAQWYALDRSPGMSSIRGEVRLRISFYDGSYGKHLSSQSVLSKGKDQKIESASFFRRVETKIRPRDSLDDPELALPVFENAILNRNRYSRLQTVLVVRVIQARNLIAMDTNGKSDPYAVIQVRKTQYKTGVQFRTLNPVWNASFEFGKGQLFLTETDVVSITLRDYDHLLRDDELGEVAIPLWSILGSCNGPTWYALKSAEVVQGSSKDSGVKVEANQDLGEVQLELSFTVIGEGFNAISRNPTFETQDRSDTVERVAESSTLVRHGSSSAALLEAVAAAKKAQYKIYNGKVWFYRMNLHVISAANLPTTDIHGGTSSFVTVSCGLKTEKTNVIKGSVNPIYKEKFAFSESSIPNASGLCRQDRIFITVRTTEERLLDLLDSSETDKLGGHIIAAAFIDLSFIIDRMGYIDKDGMLLQSWFTFDRLQNGIEYGLGGDGSQSVKTSNLGIDNQIRLKLGFYLVPVAETRLMEHEKLVLRVNRARGLDDPDKLSLNRNIFVRTKVNSHVKETSLCKMTHGHVVIHEELYFDELDESELNETIKLDVCCEETGEALSTLSVPLNELRSDGDKILEGWFPLEPAEAPSHQSRAFSSNDQDVDRHRPDFARLSVDSPDIHLSLRLVSVVDFLRPTLGFVHANLAKLKMDTNDFNNNLRCVIRYGDKKLLTRTFRGVVNVLFDPEQATFKFPVINMFTPFIFEVWNIPGQGRESISSRRTPKLMGAAHVNIYDIIELEANTMFSSEALTVPAENPPVKLKLFDAKGRRQGSLRLWISFTENLVSGSLATHANPIKHTEKPFSVANLRHEVNRTIALFKGLGSLFGSVGYVLNWNDSPSSTIGLAILVLFCVIDFWSSRVLAVFPLLALIFIINRHSDRAFGKFASHLLQKSGIGENDTKARLLLAVVRGRNLIPMDTNGKSDPLVNISLFNGDCTGPSKVKEIKLGRTRTVYKTLDPDWSSSPIGFKSSGQTNLIQWRSQSETSSGIPAFESFVDRLLFLRPSLEFIAIGTRGLSADIIRGDSTKQQADLIPRYFRCSVKIVPRVSIVNEKQKRLSNKSIKTSASANQQRLTTLPKQLNFLKGHSSSTNSGSDTMSVGSFNLHDSPESEKKHEDHSPRSFSGRHHSSRTTHNHTYSISSSINPFASIAVTRERAYQEKIRRVVSRRDSTTSWLPNCTMNECSKRLQSEENAERGIHSEKVWLSSYEKKIIHELSESKNSGVAAEYSTSPVEAAINPNWNEKLILGKDFLIDPDDVAVVSCQVSTSSKPHVIGQAFVPLGVLADDNEYVNAWFPLEILELEHTEDDPDFCEIEREVSFYNWKIIGEVLLSLRLRGANLTANVRSVNTNTDQVEIEKSSSFVSSGDSTPKLEEPSPIQRPTAQADELFESSLVISAAKELEDPAEPWSKSSALIVLDVFDEDEFTKRDFIGRAVIPLSALVKDDRIQDQPAYEKWVPLSLRFDNSKADRVLFCSAQGRITQKSTLNQSSLKAATKKHSSNLARTFLGRRKIQQEQDLKTTLDEAHPKGNNADTTDMSFDWTQPNFPFGEILVRAQIILSDPSAEEAYKAAEEAKKADKGGLIEQSRVIFKTLQTVQDRMFHLNNFLEQVKNLFNWTHPKKTEFMMRLFLFLLVLFTLVPSRVIVLFVGIFFFTERFRPLGVMAIKMKHMIALLPTNDDLVRLYTKGPLLGSLEESRMQAGSLLTNEEDGEGKTGQISKLQAQRFYQNMKDKYMTLGLRHQMIQSQHREAQESRFVVSESDCKAFGHLRLLQRGRAKNWRRYYFAIAHHQLMYWNTKDDLILQVAVGGFGDLVKVAAVSANSPDAEFLASKGVFGATLDCVILITHPEKYRLRGDEEQEDDDSSDALPMISKIANSANFSRRIDTYLVANSKVKRDFWIQNLKTHCLTETKVNKLL